MTAPLADPGVSTEVTTPDADGQFLLTTYDEPRGVTRTIAWRPGLGATWGPEHVVSAEVVGGAA